MKKKKIILLIGGHDPTGGAGIGADIETASYFNFHSLSILTCSTIQNSNGVYKINSMPKNYIYESYKKIIEEFKINVIKIGLLPSIQSSSEVLKIINDKKLKNIPIIADPIIRSGRNNILNSNKNLKFLIENIYPKVKLITPNFYEYEQLKKFTDNFKKNKFKNILITNYENSTKTITLKLKKNSVTKQKSYFIKKYNKDFHGTGCTFSTALACNIAMKNSIENSIVISLDYISKTLKTSTVSGLSQDYLNRTTKWFT